MKKLWLLPFYIFTCIIITVSCKKSVELNDVSNFIPPTPEVSIYTGLPLKIRDYHYYYSDTTNFVEFQFNYSINQDTLYSINYSGTAWYNFKYYSVSIRKAPAAGLNPTLWAYLSNDHVDSMKGYAYTNYYLYDTNNLLSSRFNQFHSRTYNYLNGNLDHTIEYCNNMDVFDDIAFQYEYYDSIVLGSNARFFPFKGYQDAGNWGSDNEFAYLPIFGKSNKNLLKSAFRTYKGGEPYEYKYHWLIHNNRIDSLYIIHDTSILQKFVYIYE